ncbi:hypothetical protein B7760_00014 [Burkholderia glumae]|nr:hypothetical protein B7760_00014 [Burkholderia glumae]
MPAPIEAAALVKRTGSPSTSTLPESGWYSPPRIFSSVDLPAPFSPMRPWTCPA